MSTVEPPWGVVDTRAARRAADRARIRRRKARRRLVVRATLAVAVVAVLVAGLATRAAPDTGTGDAVPAAEPPVPRAAEAPARPAAPADPARPPADPAPLPPAVVPTDPSADGGDPLARTLARTPVVTRAGRRERQVALTFDDGPGRETPAILRILRRAKAGATFFVVGQAVQAYPATLRATARAGFEIAEHSHTHARLAGIGAAKRRRELDGARAALRAQGLPPSRLFRPPFGVFDRPTLGEIRASGRLMVLWSADTRDYQRPGAGAIARAALAGARPGAIILLHDGGGDRSQTVAALPRILRGLRARGLRPVSVTQLLADAPGRRPPGPLPGLVRR